MPLPVFTPERYQAFVDAFMVHGPDFLKVGRKMNCSPKAAEQVWTTGWKARDFARPICEVYADAKKRLEAAIADAMPLTVQRGALAAPELFSELSKTPHGVKSVGELLSSTALEVVGTEQAILQQQRSEILLATQVGLKILSGFSVIGDAVATQLRVQAENPMNVNPRTVVGLLLDYSRAMVNIANSTKTLMENQRLLWGAPQQIIENRGVSGGAKDEEGSKERLERAATVVDALRRANLIPGIAPTEEAAYEGEEAGTASTTDVLLLPPPKTGTDT